jgi:putative proteasome-type protease
MTYCVAIAVDAGLVFCSDSRTNAGIDQVSTYSKMFRFGAEGQRQFVILSAGNLGTTQATISKIKRDIKDKAPQSLLSVKSVSEAAEYLGSISRAEQEKHAARGVGFEASFIIGGQIAGKKHRIMMVYPEGNHITSSHDTPICKLAKANTANPFLTAF